MRHTALWLVVCANRRVLGTAFGEGGQGMGACWARPCVWWFVRTGAFWARLSARVVGVRARAGHGLVSSGLRERARAGHGFRRGRSGYGRVLGTALRLGVCANGRVLGTAFGAGGQGTGACWARPCVWWFERTGACWARLSARAVGVQARAGHGLASGGLCERARATFCMRASAYDAPVRPPLLLLLLRRLVRVVNF